MFCLITQEMTDDFTAQDFGRQFREIAVFLGATNIHSGALGSWAYTDGRFSGLTESDVRAAYGPGPDIDCR